MPTFVQNYPVASFLTAAASKQTATAVDVVAGDMLVVVGMTPDSTVTLGAPSGGGLTYTLRQEVSVSSRTRVALWTAPATSSQSFSPTIVRGGNNFMWGFTVAKFSGCSGIGVSGQTNAANVAPSLSVTTTGTNSTLVVADADWVPVDGSSRAWRTPAGSTGITAGGAGELNYFHDASNYTGYIGYHAATGATGSKTVGQTSPTGQTTSIVAVELLAAADVSRPFPRRPMGALLQM
ncbi:hypothetical protein DMH04_41230 [Kibdelosporangium aridum]|uniref:Uncharacterized protein n=1 Tax=Kibdelosporangium aridum TaxID=2030 RepID=A0A428YUR3_KIBAR|nr:hypothetical protein [Kibdelosporangium aridum]RSM73437.1 hypothetical protein DMH04_41230 [Kibdelosporangium aridum]